MKKNKTHLGEEQRRAEPTANANSDSVYAVAEENYAQLNTRFSVGGQDDSEYTGLGSRSKNIQQSQELRPRLPLPRSRSVALAASPEAESLYDDAINLKKDMRPQKPPRGKITPVESVSSESLYVNLKDMEDMKEKPMTGDKLNVSATSRRPIPAPRAKRKSLPSLESDDVNRGCAQSTDSEGSLSDQGAEVFYHELEKEGSTNKGSDQNDGLYETVGRQSVGCAAQAAAGSRNVSDRKNSPLASTSKAATLSSLSKTSKAENKKNAGATLPLPLLSKMKKVPHFFAKKRTVSDPAQSAAAKPRAASGGGTEESTVKRNKNQGKPRHRKMTP